MTPGSIVSFRARIKSQSVVEVFGMVKSSSNGEVTVRVMLVVFSDDNGEALERKLSRIPSSGEYVSVDSEIIKTLFYPVEGDSNPPKFVIFLNGGRLIQMANTRVNGGGSSVPVLLINLPTQPDIEAVTVEVVISGSGMKELGEV